jgi:hypothetical protein
MVIVHREDEETNGRDKVESAENKEEKSILWGFLFLFSAVFSAVNSSIRVNGYD